MYTTINNINNVVDSCFIDKDMAWSHRKRNVLGLFSTKTPECIICRAERLQPNIISHYRTKHDVEIGNWKMSSESSDLSEPCLLCDGSTNYQRCMQLLIKHVAR